MSFGRLPGVKSVSLTPIQVRLSFMGQETGKAIVVDSALTDSGSTPTSRIRNGQVLGKHASNGRYYPADGASAKKSAQGTITSTIDIAATAASKTFKWKYKDGAEQTVTLGGGDNSVSLVVTALNADANFSADLLASASGSKLVIATKRSGAQEYFTITDGTLNDHGGGAEDTFDDDTEHGGTDGDYVVVDEFLDMVDINNVAVHAMATGYPKGEFKESNLRGLTKDARRVLQVNGSIFR